MQRYVSELKKRTSENSENYFPVFYRLSDPKDEAAFINLVKSNPALQLYDEIQGQVEELVKSINPKTVFTKQQLTEAAHKHFGNVQREKYGVWVYYSWLNKLVHILDEEEFVLVRTNRNQYKITPDEKKTLAVKRIGVIGLSVGQSIALTIAMERICCELRLADFDVLELSNLNRIRAGVYELGVKKTIMAAREIAEIDPYLKVTIFSDGLTEENVNDFFCQGGKLDVCVEVCDGLYAKIFSRQKAKEFHVPVVMNSSDKGTTDIERYDIEPTQSILHGLIDHLNLDLVKEAKTNEEKVPYLLPMLGVETSSNRLKASMLEIQETITTWPQLASGVILGGGICADVCRRILLGELKESGRYFVDLEELIKDKNKEAYKEQPLKLNPSLTDSEMHTIIISANKKNFRGQIHLKNDEVIKLVDAGSKAPSGANCQSWKFMYADKKLFLFFDDIFRPELLDCERTTMITGLGAVTENIVLKAHQLGFELTTETEIIKNDTKLVTTFRFFEKENLEVENKLEPHICDHLAKTIDSRISNRTIVDSIPIEKEKLLEIQRSVRTVPGADMIVIDNREKLEILSEITAKMDRIRYITKQGHNDFRGEARWTIEDAQQTKNGISFKETMDLTPTEFAGFYVSKDWSVVSHLADWDLGSAFGKIQRKWILGSGAVGLIIVPEFTTNNFFNGGRALERAWLTANHLGVSAHPPSLSTLIFNSYKYGPKDLLKPSTREEIKQLVDEFEKLFGIDTHMGQILLMRFFYGPDAKYRSLRYPISQILSFEK